jgi:hypothetical protein
VPGIGRVVRGTPAAPHSLSTRFVGGLVGGGTLPVPARLVWPAVQRWERAALGGGVRVFHWNEKHH